MQKSNKVKFSIKNKLALLLVCIIVIPIAALGVTTYTYSKKILTNELQKNALVIADKLNSSIDTYITGNEQNLDMLSNNLNVKDAFYKNADEIRYVVNVLQNYKDAHPDILNIYIGGPNKKMFLYPDSKLPDGFDPTTRPWYQEAVKAGKIIWTEPYVDTGTGKLTITVAKPVNDSKGQFSGVVGADIALDTLSALVSGTKLGNNGYFFIADSKGVTLAHPNKDLLNKPVAVPNFIDSIKNKQTDTVNYELNGDKKFGTFVTNNKIGWKIAGVMSYSEINGNMSGIIKVISIAAIIIAILAQIFGMLFSNTITKSLIRLVEDMKKIGSGDLTIRSKIKSNDETGVLASNLNLMAEELSILMKNVRSISSEVTTASDSLAATAEETNASTDEIAKTIGEVASATNDQAKSTEIGMEKTSELSESIQLVAGSVFSARELFDDAKTLNNKGIDIVKMLIKNTEENNNAAAKVGEEVIEVDKKSQEIGSIIDTISNIAEQTNLLALNASIEAARAGDAGRGFAVVAEEVRKLAEQSTEATSRIRDIITGIQNQSKNAVTTVAGTKEIINKQSGAVKETESVFRQITDKIKELNNQVESIVELNNGMLSKKDEIVNVMETISASAQQTSASSQEISASTEEQLATFEEVTRTAEGLNHLALKLNEEIEKFKVM